MSESENKAAFIMFLSIPNFTQQTCKFTIKKIQSLETKLDVWNQSSSASTKYAENGDSFRNTAVSLQSGGKWRGGTPQLCLSKATFLI